MPAGVGALLALTGHVITAEDALDIGLADAVVADDTRTGLCAALQQCQWSGDGSRDKVVVTGVGEGFAVSTDHAPSGTLMTHAADIAQLATCDSAPACRDTLASWRRRVLFRHRCAQSGAGSPTSAGVTFRVPARTRSLRRRCGPFEARPRAGAAVPAPARLQRRCARPADRQGSRAEMVSADWSQVTPGMIAAHFQPL